MKNYKTFRTNSKEFDSDGLDICSGDRFIGTVLKNRTFQPYYKNELTANELSKILDVMLNFDEYFNE